MDLSFAARALPERKGTAFSAKTSTKYVLFQRLLFDVAYYRRNAYCLVSTAVWYILSRGSLQIPWNQWSVKAQHQLNPSNNEWASRRILDVSKNFVQIRTCRYAAFTLVQFCDWNADFWCAWWLYWQRQENGTARTSKYCYCCWTSSDNAHSRFWSKPKFTINREG